MPITLGVDVGRFAIEAVAVSGGRTPQVVWSASVARSTGGALVEDLRRLRAAAKGPFDGVVAALPSDAASLLLFGMPFSNPKIIEKTVAGEVEGLVPTSIEGHQIAHQIVSSGKQGAQVAVAIAPPEALRSFVDALTAAGLEPRIVDLDVMALATLAAALGSPTAAARAVVDVGAGLTRIVVLAGDQVRATRVIPSGGAAMTSALVTRHGLEPEAAEAIKLDILTHYGTVPDPSEVIAAADEAQLHSLRESYANLAEDVALSVRAIEHKERIEVESVWLVGGAARARGLDRLVSERAGVPSEIPRPPEGANAAADWWPQGALAYSLALRGSRTTRGSALNFRHGAFAYGRDVREVTRRVAPVAVPVAAIVLAGLVSFTVRYVSLRSEAKSVREEVFNAFRAEFGDKVPIQDPEAQIKQQIRAIDKKIAVFAMPAPPAEILRSISAATPPELDVTLDNGTIEGARVTITGRADRFETIERLKTAWSGTEPFGDVRIQDQSKPNQGGQVQFTMVLEVKPEGEDEEAS